MEIGKSNIPTILKIMLEFSSSHYIKSLPICPDFLVSWKSFLSYLIRGLPRKLRGHLVFKNGTMTLPCWRNKQINPPPASTLSTDLQQNKNYNEHTFMYQKEYLENLSSIYNVELEEYANLIHRCFLIFTWVCKHIALQSKNCNIVKV